MQMEDGLQKLLLGQYDEAVAALEGLESAPQAEKIRRIAQMHAELAAYTKELSKGNLSVAVPGPENVFAASLKTLHAKLKRLARQLLMAATGYPVPSIDYMGDLSDGLDFLVAQAMQRQQQLEYDRDHDAETGLLNRKAFIRGVYDIIRTQPGRVGVLFCCALDNLKYINNTHGYEAGDIYIGRVVEVLGSCGGGLSLLSRPGGDEFAVYAHGFDNEEDAYRFVRDSMKSLINTRVSLPREEVKIRASCGVAVYPHDAVTSDVLMNYASHAMFEVQTLNRGTIMRFSPEIYRSKAGLLGRQERLDELIEEKLIRFAFQPIVNLRDAKISGYEALMRPTTAEFSCPLEVLSLAEAQSKLPQLEKITFETIFEWIFSNIGRLGPRKIFFNTISAEYLDIAALRTIHPQYEAISKSMVFEILETAAVESMLFERIKVLRRELSASIALDDFGCGHSNAIRLISISPDILKIDRFFISSIHNAPATKREFLSNILAYCRAKGIQTLAEGVETREELAGVAQMGFDYAQGFYLGRPEFDLLESLTPRMEDDILSFAPRDGSV